MKKNITLLENTPVFQAILRLAFPSVLAMMVQVIYGLTDTFSKLEHNGTAHPVNGVNSYYIDGKRYSRGLECHLSLGFFIQKHDACSVTTIKTIR